MAGLSHLKKNKSLLAVIYLQSPETVTVCQKTSSLNLILSMVKTMISMVISELSGNWPLVKGETTQSAMPNS